MPSDGRRTAEVPANLPWGQVGKELVLLAAAACGIGRAEEVAEAALDAVRQRGWQRDQQPLWAFLTDVLIEGVDGKDNREKAKADAIRVTALGTRALDDELRALGLDPARAFAMGERHRPAAPVATLAADSTTGSLPTLSARQWAVLTLTVFAVVAMAWAAVALRG